jgi:RND family efflux transporter MFP subunit
MGLRTISISSIKIRIPSGLSLASQPLKKAALTFLFAFVMISLFACDSGNQYAPPPPPTVTVSQPVQRDVTDYLEVTGNTQAVQRVEVRARVKGFLQSIHFTEGALVNEGDLLYTIEDGIYKAQVDKARADLTNRQVTLRLADMDFKRIENLYKKGASPKAKYDQAKAARDAAQADVMAAKAVLDDAELSLSFTKVRAPIRARAGRNLVSVGNLVGAGENTHLTTLVQYDPIWAYFSLNEQELLQLMKLYRNKNGGQNQPAQPSAIHLALAGEEGYPHEGQLDFIDQGLDPSTGTFLLRGSFENPKPHKILPGMFARIRLPVEKRLGALLITERALSSDQGGRYVLVVNGKNLVERRPVKTGATVDGMRVITQGLKPDDWVVVKGLLRARPGLTVKPVRQNSPAQTQ